MDLEACVALGASCVASLCKNRPCVTRDDANAHKPSSVTKA